MTSISINEEEGTTIRIAEPFAATAGQNTHVRGSITSEIVVFRAPNLNHMRRLDRLGSAWIQGSPALRASPSLVFDEGFDVVENPSRRSRTALTEKEVEAIQTAREGGESVMSIAKRFGIHRATVWEHTKLRPTEERSDTWSGPT